MATLEESFSQLTVENRMLGELKAKERQAATAYEEAVDRRTEHQTDWRNLDDLVNHGIIGKNKSRRNQCGMLPYLAFNAR